jgi:hypothetical protein
MCAVSVVSLYEFEHDQPEKAGWFRASHVSLGAGATLHLPELEQARSLLLRVRPDDEELLDLSAVFNEEALVARLDRILGEDVRRLGLPLRASYVTWARAELRDAEPERHQDWEVLVTVNLDFHLCLDWRTDAGGTVVYYVFFYLDEQGVLHGEVEGGSFAFTGGYPFDTGEIFRGLEKSLPRGFAPLQAFLDEKIAGFAAERRYSEIYLLPGRGEKRGRRRWGSADKQVCLGLLRAE